MIDIYGLDDSAARWRQAAAAISADILTTHAAEVDARARFPSEGMTALPGGGFYGLCIDTHFGGHGQGPGTFSAVVEEFARRCPSTAMVYVMHVAAAKVIETSTTFLQQAEILRAIAGGCLAA